MGNRNNEDKHQLNILKKRRPIRVIGVALMGLTLMATDLPNKVAPAVAEERITRELNLPSSLSDLEVCDTYWDDEKSDGYFSYFTSVDARQQVRVPKTVNLRLYFSQACSSDITRYERSITLSSGETSETVFLGFNPTQFSDDPYWAYPGVCGAFRRACYKFDETVPINFTVDYSQSNFQSKNWDLTFDVKYIDEVCRYEGDFGDPNRVRVCEDKQISLTHTIEDFIVTDPLTPEEFEDLYGYDPRPEETEPSQDSDADQGTSDETDDPGVIDENKDSEQVLNAGSFKGYVALYVKGYGGARFSAKVGNDWVIIPIVESSFERYVEFTGAGYEINVRMYINRELITTKTITTR